MADERSQFTLVDDERHPYCVQIEIDASVEYPKLSPGAGLVVELPPPASSRKSKQKIYLPLWGLSEDLGGGVRKLRMPLDCERGTVIESLAELSDRIQKKNATDAEIFRRDVLFQYLLSVAGELHKRRQTIGLLDPGNVLYYIVPKTSQRETELSQEPADEQIQLLLPDLHFVPRSGTPMWVESRQHYDFIWRSEYEKPNSNSEADDEGQESRSLRRKYLDRQSNSRTFDPAKDNRCLARLL
ncbi:MAG: hypothetical protein KDA84_02905, partial [Planctomycetaceae bacterium]|nr:hypothetical protein [Planctomycetaceae bacterium]